MDALDLSQSGGIRGVRRAQWRGHVLTQLDSGLSAAAYCREHGLDAASFYRWKRVLRESGELPGETGAQGRGRRERAAASSGMGARPPLFAEVRLAGAGDAATAPGHSAGAGVEVCLRGGQVVRVAAGFDAQTLRRVLAVLEGASC